MQSTHQETDDRESTINSLWAGCQVGNVTQKCFVIEEQRIRKQKWIAVIAVAGYLSKRSKSSFDPFFQLLSKMNPVFTD